MVFGCVLLAGCKKADETPPPKPAPPPEANEPVELKIKWTPGKKYVHRLEMTRTVKVNLPTSPQPSQQVLNMAFDYTISVLKDLPGGGHELQIEFLGEKVESKTNDRTVASFDSSQDQSTDAANPAAAALRKVIGGKVKYLTAADGKVEQVEGYKEFMQRLSGDPRSPGQAIARSVFSEETIKQFCDLGRTLPTNAVAVGSQWSIQREFAVGPVGRGILSENYTFQSWDEHGSHKCAVVKFSGDVSSKGPEVVPGASVEIVNGTSSGTTWFDPELGLPVEYDGSQDSSMKITSRGKSITNQISLKLNLKLARVQ